MDRQYEIGLTERLATYEEKFNTLRPRQQDRVVFARRFRQALREKKVSQKALSETLGVSSSLVSQWANAISAPANDQVRALSDFFGEDVSAWATPDSPDYVTSDGMHVEVMTPPVEYRASAESGISMVGEAPASYGVPALTLTEEETALIHRVRRMSQEERDALYILLHVLR